MAVGDSQIITVTDLFLSKIRETPDAIFIQYPETPKGKSDYVGYTVTDIDRLADEGAWQYTNRGLKADVGSLSHARIITRTRADASTSHQPRSAK